MHRAFSSTLVLMALTFPLAAQVPAGMIPAPAASVLFGAARSLHVTVVSDSVRDSVPPTQWKRGLLIGGIAGGAGFGVLGFGVCQSLRESNEGCLGPTLAVTAIGALVGGTIGALIGGQFSQHPRVSIDSSSAGP